MNVFINQDFIDMERKVNTVLEEYEELKYETPDYLIFVLTPIKETLLGARQSMVNWISELDKNRAILEHVFGTKVTMSDEEREFRDRIDLLMAKIDAAC